MKKRNTSRHYLIIKHRQVLKQYAVASAAILAVATLALIILFQQTPQDAHAAVAGDFRSRQSGSWSVSSTWERFNGSAWIPASVVPTSADNTIEIQPNHVITIGSSVTLDQLQIDAGGTLSLSSGCTLTVNNDAGTDINCEGTLDIYGTLVLNASTAQTVSGTVILRSGSTLTRNTGAVMTVSGTLRRVGGVFPTTATGFLTFAANGIYDHAMNGDNIPVATWNSNSGLNITGVTSTAPGQLNQSFSNVTWSTSGLLNDINLGGTLTSVRDLTISNTGTYSLFIDQEGTTTILNVSNDFNIVNGTTYLTSNGLITVNIAGNLNITDGKLNFNQADVSSYGSNSGTLNISGNLTMTGGVIDLNQSTSNNSAKGLGIINLNGNMSLGSGILTESSQSGKGEIFFSGSSLQSVVCSNRITSRIDYYVNANANVDLKQSVLGGTGTFTMNSGSTLNIGHTEGISLAGATGNIQCSGLRTFSSTGDYVYNGNAMQITGAGLPSQVRNITLKNNSNVDVSNSFTITNSINLIQGILIASNDTITLGTSGSSVGAVSRTSGHIVGSFRRWISNNVAANILFPVGTMNSYNYANFSFTTAPTSAGTLICNLVANGNVSSNGLPVTESGDYLSNIGYAYWNVASMNGLFGGTWTLSTSAEAFPGISNVSTLHLVRRASASSPWTLHGTHVTATGSTGSPVLSRASMTLYGQYGVAGGAYNPLPIELMYFNAINNDESVNLEWATASEINNEYFTIERSADGESYTEIKKVEGAGNSTTRNNYSWIDNDPLNGISYYRLKQTDFDGQYTYSDPAKVRRELFEDDKAIVINTVAPNPFENEFRVVFEVQHSGDVAIALVDAEGIIQRSIDWRAVSGLNSFEFTELGNLAKGIYFVKISNEHSSKMVKLIHR